MDLVAPHQRAGELSRAADGERLRSRLDALQHLIIDLPSSNGLEPFLEHIVTAAIEATRAPAAVLVLDSPPLDAKRLHTAGLDPSTREAVANQLTGHDPGAAPAGPPLAGAAVLAVDVVSGTGRHGQLSAVDASGTHQFGPDERAALETCAAVAAMALDVAVALETAHRRSDSMGERLADEEALLAAIVDGLPQGMAWSDGTGRIESGNKALVDLLGASSIDEVAGRTWPDLLPADGIGELVHAWSAEVISEAEPILSRELSFSTAGSERLVLVSVVPLDSAAAAGRVLTVWADITDQRSIENRLVESSRLESVGQLAAGVAHEINTPMQYIGGNGAFLEQAFNRATALVDEVVEAAVASGVERAELDRLVAGSRIELLKKRTPRAADQIADGIDAVSRIVRALKTFAHPGGHEFEPTNLAQTVTSTVAVVHQEWKNVAEIDVVVPDELPPIRAVPGLLNQVFLNLIVNAAHAIDERRTREGHYDKGHISITAEPHGGQVEIRVSDDGCGIPDEIRDRVYDQFFTTKEIGKGTGQGLSVCRNVVTRHGGTIQFVSSPGGTTFSINLPLWEPERHDEREPAATSRNGTS
jgi:PAS domain S-box-containing protein